MGSGAEKIENLIVDAIDHVNAIKRTKLGMDNVGVELLQTLSIILNAVKRYYVGVENDTISDLNYALELIKTAMDGLKRALRQLEKRLR